MIQTDGAVDVSLPVPIVGTYPLVDVEAALERLRTQHPGIIVSAKHCRDPRIGMVGPGSLHRVGRVRLCERGPSSR